MNSPLVPRADAGPVSGGATAPAVGTGPVCEGGPAAEPPYDRAPTGRYRLGNTCAARPRPAAR
ncbi:hypothetical protein A6A07_13100 [Streptomyces sp. CB03911]|nr:hypothetical protein A6A07_13100 [Streptomyces sp. CB03911]